MADLRVSGPYRLNSDSGDYVGHEVGVERLDGYAARTNDPAAATTELLTQATATNDTSPNEHQIAGRSRHCPLAQDPRHKKMRAFLRAEKI